MGSPISPVVANLCMEAIEEMAINTTSIPPKVWKRYVDDSFCILKRTAVNSFHNILNSIDPHISFTIEEESNHQIAFLDTLVSRENNTITTLTSTAETLLHPAIKLPSTAQERNTELNYVSDALRSNNCPPNVISNILKKKSSKPPKCTVPTPEELVYMFFKWAHHRKIPAIVMQFFLSLMASRNQ